MKHTFKTNINCSGCVAGISSHLNANKAIKHWEVDTRNPDKLLTVETNNLSGENIQEIIKKAGFKAEIVNQ